MTPTTTHAHSLSHTTTGDCRSNLTKEPLTKGENFYNHRLLERIEKKEKKMYATNVFHFYKFFIFFL